MLRRIGKLRVKSIINTEQYEGTIPLNAVHILEVKCRYKGEAVLNLAWICISMDSFI